MFFCISFQLECKTRTTFTFTFFIHLCSLPSQPSNKSTELKVCTKNFVSSFVLFLDVLSSLTSAIVSCFGWLLASVVIIIKPPEECISKSLPFRVRIVHFKLNPNRV
jgi:hypothetical protein